ncbi:MAG: GPW/gp25 family protein [Chloroflexota bacterium]
MNENMRNKEFLGQGLAFPFQVNPRGEIALARGERDIEQSIRIILETMPGERVMRPEFGCRIWELVFAPRNPTTEGLLIHYVEQALSRWEPRIDLTEVRVSDDPVNEGAVLLEIDYLIKSTHDERSLVHPFYITAEE